MQTTLLGCGAFSLASQRKVTRLSQRRSGILLPLAPRRQAAPGSNDFCARAAAASDSDEEFATTELTAQQVEARRLARQQQREREQAVYKASAMAATVLIISVATFATYFRILWHVQDAGDFPVVDLAATLLLVAGGMVGMEMYARYAHARWHDVPLLWTLHKSHHEPRLGPFERNDLYAVINALPAMALCLYGFLTPDLGGSMCFGAGLGITLFGISYVFVHDGMVHRRFPVGPLADSPYFRRLTVAHQLHHSDKYGGVPFGLFLGPQELEAVGAGPELDRLVAELGKKQKKAAAAGSKA